MLNPNNKSIGIEEGLKRINIINNIDRQITDALITQQISKRDYNALIKQTQFILTECLQDEKFYLFIEGIKEMFGEQQTAGKDSNQNGFRYGKAA